MTCEFLRDFRNFTESHKDGLRFKTKCFELTFPAVRSISGQVVAGVISGDDEKRHEHNPFDFGSLKLRNDAVQLRIALYGADIDVGIALCTEFVLQFTIRCVGKVFGSMPHEKQCFVFSARRNVVHDGMDTSIVIGFRP